MSIPNRDAEASVRPRPNRRGLQWVLRIPPALRHDRMFPLGSTLICMVLAFISSSTPMAREPKAPTAETDARAVQNGQVPVTVAINQSRVIKLRTPVARVSVANPEIADLLVLTPQQVFVVGKKIGNTNMMLWDDKEQLRESLLLEVTPDIEQLKTRLHQVLPNERVQVRAAQGTIVVSGEVSSPSKAEAAIKLAESYAASARSGVAGGAGGLAQSGLMAGGMGAGGAGAAAGAGSQSAVLNMLQVGGSQQVMLEVKIAEVQRSLVRQLDMNFSGFYNGGGLKIGTLNPGQYTYPNAQGTKTILGEDYRFPYFFPDASFPTTITNRTLTGTGDAQLNSQGYEGTDSLSRSIQADSTQTNSFNTTTTTATTGYNPRLGTNVPAYAVPNAANMLNKGLFAQYLAGNVLLNAYIDAAKANGLARILAEPNLTTLSGQEARFNAGGEFPYQVAASLGQAPGIEFKKYGIGLRFIPVVLDSGVISLKLSVVASELDWANTINGYPGIKERSADVTVEVKTGQSISIAGLISEDLRENINRFPGLGEIPILGMLFSSQAFNKKQTELVILVTPRLASAFDPQQAKLPTDDFVEPSDLEFYLLGRTQGRKPKAVNAAPAPADTLGPDKSGSEGPFGHDL